jgi:serine/threonine protein kinase
VFCEYPRLFLVLELVTGGELFDRIVAKEYFSEKCARDIIKEALLILCYLHGDARVVHRDIKPENFIMASGHHLLLSSFSHLIQSDNSDDSRLKLVDFGFAARVQDLKPNEVSVGTPVYVAPEIIRGDPYGTGLSSFFFISSLLISFQCEEVDMWSFGVICYIVLCGCPPFLDDDISGLLDKIVEGHLTFEEEHWKEVSIEAIDFCRKMLCVDQCDRFVHLVPQLPLIFLQLDCKTNVASQMDDTQRRELWHKTSFEQRQQIEN